MMTVLPPPDTADVAAVYAELDTMRVIRALQAMIAEQALRIAMLEAQLTSTRH